MRKLISDQSGQDLVEYSLLVAMIAFAVVLSVKSVGIELAHGFDQISSDLASSL